MISPRIRGFLAETRTDEPCLVIDLDQVRRNFEAFRHAMPESAVYYAVKANPHPEILRLLANAGSNFDCASVPEIDMALEAGATPERISYGNTIKKERDIARAHERGVCLFAVDSHAEVEKVARAAPGAKIFCRILTDGAGAEWPLSRKFGCDPEMAIDVLELGHRLGLKPTGISFHVGSQQTDPAGWDNTLATAADIFRELDTRGIRLTMVNLGGGFPTRYLKEIPTLERYGQTIYAAIRRFFGNRIPDTIIEPGRGMVGNSGVIRAEVVLVSKKSDDDPLRWVFLDIGKFGGLAETMEEAIRYVIVTERDDDVKMPCVLAGPTCDSADVLYEKTPYDLPASLTAGDEVLIEGAGAYTSTYSSVAFNGFSPLTTYVI
ncbi:MAG: type III PLP-dependent enzyme [Salaquimonas sp.]|nr:type III PLP-dependent enzyme [Salaquimonas sp.]